MTFREIDSSVANVQVFHRDCTFSCAVLNSPRQNGEGIAATLAEQPLHISSDVWPRV